MLKQEASSSLFAFKQHIYIMSCVSEIHSTTGGSLKSSGGFQTKHLA